MNIEKRWTDLLKRNLDSNRESLNSSRATSPRKFYNMFEAGSQTLREDYSERRHSSSSRRPRTSRSFQRSPVKLEDIVPETKMQFRAVKYTFKPKFLQLKEEKHDYAFKLQNTVSLCMLRQTKIKPVREMYTEGLQNYSLAKSKPKQKIKTLQKETPQIDAPHKHQMKNVAIDYRSSRPNIRARVLPKPMNACQSSGIVLRNEFTERNIGFRKHVKKNKIEAAEKGNLPSTKDEVSGLREDRQKSWPNSIFSRSGHTIRQISNGTGPVSIKASRLDFVKQIQSINLSQGKSVRKRAKVTEVRDICQPRENCKEQANELMRSFMNSHNNISRIIETGEGQSKDRDYVSRRYASIQDYSYYTDGNLLKGPDFKEDTRLRDILKASKVEPRGAIPSSRSQNEFKNHSFQYEEREAQANRYKSVVRMRTEVPFSDSPSEIWPGGFKGEISGSPIVKELKGFQSGGFQNSSLYGLADHLNIDNYIFGSRNASIPSIKIGSTKDQFDSNFESPFKREHFFESQDAQLQEPKDFKIEINTDTENYESKELEPMPPGISPRFPMASERSNYKGMSNVNNESKLNLKLKPLIDPISIDPLRDENNLRDKSLDISPIYDRRQRTDASNSKLNNGSPKKHYDSDSKYRNLFLPGSESKEVNSSARSKGFSFHADDMEGLATNYRDNMQDSSEISNEYLTILEKNTEKLRDEKSGARKADSKLNLRNIARLNLRARNKPTETESKMPDPKSDSGNQSKEANQIYRNLTSKLANAKIASNYGKDAPFDGKQAGSEQFIESVESEDEGKDKQLSEGGWDSQLLNKHEPKSANLSSFLDVSRNLKLHEKRGEENGYAGGTPGNLKRKGESYNRDKISELLHKELRITGDDHEEVWHKKKTIANQLVNIFDKFEKLTPEDMSQTDYEQLIKCIPK